MATTSTWPSVLTIGNGKGGVGKTTISANVAGLAAASGWRTLVLDLDPQGNVGQILGYTWRGESDDGAHLVQSLMRGAPMEPVLRDVRPGLDVVCGGTELDTLEDVLVGKVKRTGGGVDTLLLNSLAPLAQQYDLVVIDTPPTRPLLLRQALAATRWLVVPTKPGRMSIEGLRTLANEVIAVRTVNPQLRVLGGVLYDVETSASTIRKNALEDMHAVLGDAAPVFQQVIRHATAPVVQSEEEGLLIHELAEQVATAEPWWKALRAGETPKRLAGSAPALADDLGRLTLEILAAITTDLETTA